MTIVADASVLVAELIRIRGWALFGDPSIRFVVSEDQWNEARYEIERRLFLIVEQERLTNDEALRIKRQAQQLINDNAIEVVAAHAYHHLEAVARRRIPRDPNDWPTVALAIALGAGILTEDHDFLGCGCATWTFETLRDEMAHRGTSS